MTKGSKKTRWNSRIWRHLAQILTFCMEIEPKTLFCFEFRYLPAFVLIVFVIFVLSLIEYNKKWARVSKELGQRVQIRGIIRRIWTLWPSSFETLAHFLLYSISLSTKMTKTINRNTGKYRNLRQNNVFGSIFIQNVQIWAKFHEFGPFDRVLLKPLLIFCCILSGWAQKWQRQSTQTLASIEIQSKTTFWAQFPYKTSKFEPNVAKFDCFSEFSLNLWSFFVVSYQAEQENAQGLQDIHW